MADAIIQLPDDASNTGKKVRTQTRIVGANTVHEHYTILQDASGDTQPRVLTDLPAAGTPGLVTRNIPWGTQSGDYALVDGAAPSVRATVKDYTNANPLVVSLANATGDVYNANEPRRVTTGTFQNVQVTTTATQILAANPSRLSAVVQNVDEQQIAIGLSSSVTVASGLYLAPVSGSSGDGGVFGVSGYTGAIFGITASGDAACRAMEI